MATKVSDNVILTDRGIKWSAELEKHSRLHVRRLVSCECGSGVEPGTPLPTETLLNVQSAGELPALIFDGNLGFYIDTFLKLRMTYAKKPDQSAVGISVKVRSVYKLDENSPKFRDEHYRSFAQWSCQEDCWPYLTELVQSLTVRMGLPPYNIPPHWKFIAANQLATTKPRAKVGGKA